jgi:hypothetical protein
MCKNKNKMVYLFTDIKNESTDDFFKNLLFPLFKHLVPVSDNSPVILNLTLDEI